MAIALVMLKQYASIPEAMGQYLDHCLPLESKVPHQKGAPSGKQNACSGQPADWLNTRDASM